MKKESNLSVRLKELVLAGAVRLAFGKGAKQLDYAVEQVHADPPANIIRIYAGGKLRATAYFEETFGDGRYYLPHFRLLKWNRPKWEGTSHRQP